MGKWLNCLLFLEFLFLGSVAVYLYSGIFPKNGNSTKMI